MFEHKGAPSIVVGLLLLFLCFPLFAGDEGFIFSGGGGTLWAEEDGVSGYWHGGVLFRGIMPLFAGIDRWELRSGLPWADLDGQGLSWTFGVETKPLDFRLSGLFAQHSRADFFGGDAYSEEGDATFLHFALPFRIGLFEIEPSYLHGSGSWKDGDFYWFLGKPAIPQLSFPGLAVSYNRQHSLNFYYLTMQADIVNTKDEPLFDLVLDGFTGFYRFSLGGEKPAFAGTLGWLYGSGSLEGALTSANQLYFGFPYRFFNVDADMDLHIGYLILDTHLSKGLFDFHFSLGAVHGFAGGVSAKVSYKKKKDLFYDGSEGREEFSPSLEGIGAAFLLIDISAPSLRIGRGKSLYVGMGKVFAMPWGFESFSLGNEENAADSGGGDQSRWLQTIFLSGLSLDIKFILN